eukprot:gene13442-14787_t
MLYVPCLIWGLMYLIRGVLSEESILEGEITESGKQKLAEICRPPDQCNSTNVFGFDIDCYSLIDSKRKVLMEFTPKASCTSAVVGFFKAMGLEHEVDYIGWPHDFRDKYFHNSCGRATPCHYVDPQWFRWKIVRNPYDRAVSNYLYCMVAKVIRNVLPLSLVDVSFEEFIDYLLLLPENYLQLFLGRHAGPQIQAYERHAYENHLPPVFNVVVKVEESEIGLQKIFEQVGVKEISALITKISTIDHSKTYKMKVAIHSGYSDRWISFCIVGLVTFVGDCARGILFSALWPLCQDLGGSKVDYGYLVASFSFGRMVVATPLGMFSDHYRHRHTLLISTAILCLGTVLWLNAASFGGLPTLYIAQMVLGLGTGSLGVTRSYVVELAVPERRTIMLARLSALQYAGFAGTPILGSALVAAGVSFPSDYQYCLPAVLLLILSILSWSLLVYPFKNVEVINKIEGIEPVLKNDAESKDIETQQPEQEREGSIEMKEMQTNKSEKNMISEGVASNNNDVANPLHSLQQLPTNTITSTKEEESTQSFLSSLKQQTFLLMIFLNFTTRGCISVYETEISRILLDNFHFTQIELGATVSLAGILGTIQLIYFKELWVNNFSDYALMSGGLMFMIISQAFVINWEPNLQQYVWQVILALYCIYGFSYPISNSAALGSFSKIQKTGKQSTTQSYFALMGSAARILFPILAGYCEGDVGSNSSFNIVLIFAAISLLGITYWKEGIIYYTIGDLTSSEPVIGLKTLSSQQWSMLFVSLIAIAVGFYSLLYDGVSQ